MDDFFGAIDVDATQRLPSEVAETDLQARVFRSVEEMLSDVGAGDDKSLGKSESEHLKVKISDYTMPRMEKGMNTNELGMRLSDALKTMISFGPGVFQAIVHSNYPLFRYQIAKDALRAKLQAKFRDQESEKSIIGTAPDLDVFRVLGELALQDTKEEIEKLEIQQNEKIAALRVAFQQRREESKTASGAGEEEKENETVQGAHTRAGRGRSRNALTVNEDDFQNEFDAFLESHHVTVIDFKAKLEKAIVDAELQWKRDFRSAHEKHLANVEKVHEAEKKSKKLSIELSQEVVRYEICNGFNTAIVMIVGKLKAVVQNQGEIKRTLSTMIEIDSTKEIIRDPYTDGNLSGIFASLHKNYFKATYSTFSRSLLSALKWSLPKMDSDRSPMKGVREVQEIAATWARCQFFKFLTEDVLFTTLLLNGLHDDSEIKEVATAKVLEWIQQREVEGRMDDGVTVTGDFGNMPIFRSLSAWIQMREESKAFGKTGGGGSGATGGQDNSSQQRPNRQDTWSRRRGGNLENAAAANDSSKGSSTDSKLDYHKQVFARHDVIITVTRRDGESKIRYTATTAVCHFCFNKDGSKNMDSTHKPRCSNHKCFKCNLFGHDNQFCRQIVQENANAAAENSKTYGEKADKADD